MGFIDIYYTVDKDELLKIAKENKESLALVNKKLDDLKTDLIDSKTDQAKVKSLSEELSSETDSLAEAVAENTPK